MRVAHVQISQVCRQNSAYYFAEALHTTVRCKDTTGLPASRKVVPLFFSDGNFTELLCNFPALLEVQEVLRLHHPCQSETLLEGSLDQKGIHRIDLPHLYLN